MLTGRLALVTGAASGIGNEIAKSFARHEATVIMIDIQPTVYQSVNDLDKSKGQNHSAFTCDVSSSEQVTKLFTDIKERYPEQKVPNVIVNCAGIFILKRLIETTDEVYDKIMNTNLKGTFLITRAAAQELVKNYSEENFKALSTYASIINISSIASKSSFFDNQCVYAATKGGMNSMTKVIADELAKYKIRCNSVLPGAIRTPMNDLDVRPAAKVHCEMSYMKRFGETSEVADLCIFLASDMSSFITGALIECTGGMLA